jgi:hypothetical protein
MTDNNEDWLLCVGDGNNFNASKSKKIWGISSSTTNSKGFSKKVKEGDRLWFIRDKTQGKILAVATFKSQNVRVLDPSSVNKTMTNEELGWIGNGNWDIEIHYIDLYDLSNDNYLTHIKGQCSIRKYNENCLINLAEEYLVIILIKQT